MNVLANEPTSIAKILDASFKLFKLSFTKLIGLGLLSGIISASSSYFTAGMFGGLATEDMSGLSANLPLFLGAIIFVLFLLFVIYGAMIYRIDNIAKQQDDTVMEAILFSLKKSPRMLLALILYYIAMVLAMFLLVIPGLILMISLSFFPYFIILEVPSAYQSLKSSHKLVWKDWWRTMGVFTVPSILIMIIIFVFGFVAAFTGIGEEGMGLVEASMNMLSSIYMPYLMVLGYIQFHDLKLRKSGSDLEARMAK